MAPSPTRLIGLLLPARLYHWLVVRLATLPGAPARPLPHSVVLRHPLHPRGDHYLLIPTDHCPTVLELPRPAAQRLEEDIRMWLDSSGWTNVLVVVNFGAFQETPFLHVHLIRGSEPPTGGQPATDWLSVELSDEGGPVVSGRRVVRYSTVDDTAEVATEVHRA